MERAHKGPADRLDQILESRQINPAILRADRFDAFIRDRARRLIDLISEAMGKKVTGRDSDEVISAFGAALSEPRPEESIAE